jgi:hypothetical protein
MLYFLYIFIHVEYNMENNVFYCGKFLTDSVILDPLLYNHTTVVEVHVKDTKNLEI